MHHFRGMADTSARFRNGALGLLQEPNLMLDPGTVGLVTAVFVASSVECVEAFTIVLRSG